MGLLEPSNGEISLQNKEVRRSVSRYTPELPLGGFVYVDPLWPPPRKKTRNVCPPISFPFSLNLLASFGAMLYW